jgi:hypothetical protein
MLPNNYQVTRRHILKYITYNRWRSVSQLPNNYQVTHRHIPKDITYNRWRSVSQTVGSNPRGLAKNLEMWVCKQIILLFYGFVAEFEILLSICKRMNRF